MDDDIHSLKRELKSVQVDWDGTFAKFQALYARLAKQARKADERAENGPGDTNAWQPDRGEPLPGTAHLATRFRRR